MRSKQRFGWMVCCFLLGLCAVVAAQEVHETGRVRFSITGQGLLNTIESNAIAANFVYPLDTANPRAYLQFYSDIWAGTRTPPVASGFDANAQGQLVLGEWKAVAGGEPHSIPSIPGRQAIQASYEAQPSNTSALPFSVLVDQTSYAWDGTLPESNGVVLNFTLTNQTDIAIDNLFFAFGMNWDVDTKGQPQGNRSLDFVEWQDSRRASMYRDGEATDGTNPVQIGTVLLEGRLFAHRIVPITAAALFIPDPTKAQLFGQEAINDTTAVAADYTTILVVGPISLTGLRATNVMFAFVGGENRTELEENIDAIRQASLRPEQLAASAEEDGIRLTWEPPISPSVIGYSVMRTTEGSTDFQPIGPRIQTTTEFTDADAEPGVRYVYRVHPVNVAEEVLDAPSSPVTAATAKKPPTVTQFSASSVVEGGRPLVQVKLTLPPDAVPAQTQVLLYRNETGQEPWTQIQTVAATQPIIDREVAPGKKYYYAVRLLGDIGPQGDLSAAASVEIPARASLKPAADLKTVTVSPNPVRRSGGKPVRFANLPHPATIEIYTVSGERIVRLDNLGSAEVLWKPDTDIAPGVYLYQIQFLPEAESDNNVSSPKRQTREQITGKIAILE